MKKIILVCAILLIVSGCSDQVTFEQAASKDPVGFLHGLWHGIISPISFICSLFSDDIAIYAIYNNGGWYDFGFMFSIGSGGVACSCSSK